jgi:hypothetical protein
MRDYAVGISDTVPVDDREHRLECGSHTTKFGDTKRHHQISTCAADRLKPTRKKDM